MKKILHSSVIAVLLFAGCNSKKAESSDKADSSAMISPFFSISIETTMRVLPPMPDETIENMECFKIKERNILKILVNESGNIVVAIGDEQYQEIALDDLKVKAKNFILNIDNDDKLPEKKNTDFKLPDGTTWTYPVSLGVTSLQCEKFTPYEQYLQVQNELTRAFNEIRDEVSKEVWGKPFNELTSEESEVITKAVPMKISEAEPRE